MKKNVNNNINSILSILFRKFGLKYRSEILDTMKEHPFFPNFQSFHNILKKEGIDSIVIETTIEQIRDELPKPVLVYINSNTGQYLLIDNIDDKNVLSINKQGNIVFHEIKDFTKNWDGNAMIFDSENIIAKSISFHERIRMALKKIKKPFVLISTITLFAFLIYNRINDRDISNYLFIVISIAGLFFSFLLLVTTFDANNTFIKKICSPKKRK